ncbi:MAG: tetratricopeptide repeat protein [Deltaproteobacteria bacterium]|nr:tetratricopeptide repeat protein [Deltaproteobacteria bacterium]
MTTETSKEQFAQGKRFLKEDNMDRALRAFEKAYKEDKEDPDYLSYYGLCKALRAGEIGFGLELCTKAIKKEFFKAEYYTNLGKVYLAAGNKKGAIKVFLKGLKFEPNNEEMHRYLVDLGFRKDSVIRGLGRANPVNKFLGILFRRTLPEIFKKKKKGS